MRGPKRLSLRETEAGPCRKHASRPQVEANHACRGRCRPVASGIYVHACPRPRAGLGLGRRDWPRPEVETSMCCTRINLPRFRIT
eukprot:39216-Chlamydomonas_euryale.AAC.1